MRRWYAISLALLCTLTWLMAKDFWEKPFTEWKHSEVLKMLSDSPWATQVILTEQRQGRDTRSVGGEMEIYNAYTVRFFSALPVRQAFVRMFQIMNKYDDLAEADQAAFDQRFAPALNLDTSQTIMIALDFSTNDRQLGMEVERQLRQVTADQLKQSAYLITDNHGRVEIQQYFPPAPDGTGAKFIYPRVIEGEPAVDARDKEVKFEFWVPGTGHKVFATWKVKKMLYNGEVAI